MAMPRTPAPITTIEELLDLPEDGLRHELLDGVHVVTPGPELPHQGIVGRLYLALAGALAQRDDLSVTHHGFTRPRRETSDLSARGRR